MPAVNPSWDDSATGQPAAPAWGEQASSPAWEDGPATPSPSWDDSSAAPASPSWDDGSTAPVSPSWDDSSTAPASPSWDDTASQPAAAWEDGLGSGPAMPPPAASTGPLPAISETGPVPTFGAPRTGDGASQPPRLPVRPPRAFGNGGGGPGKREVVVPPAGPDGQGNRLPIFESVESDWFRRGRHSADRSTSGTPAAESTSSWTSAADEGWRAAEAVSKPASGGITLSGLPKRVPKANLVPGTVGANPDAEPSPARSAAATRQRFESFQRGVREARAAANREDDAGGEGDDVT